MKRFFNNLSYKIYNIFLLVSGLVLCFIYSFMIGLKIKNFIFADESIAAVTFTFTKLLVLPLAVFLSYISVLILMYILNTIRIRAFEKPDKILVLKHIGLSVLIVAATFIAMQFNTVLYTDGKIVSNNLIEKTAPEYTIEDYKSVVFHGESIGSAIPNRAPRIYFYFDLTFFIDDYKYIEFHPENFRNHKTLYNIGQTLGDKLMIWPEEGFPSNIIANMSESDYVIYKMMYKGIMPSDDIYEDITEAETQEEPENESEEDYHFFDEFYGFNQN